MIESLITSAFTVREVYAALGESESGYYAHRNYVWPKSENGKPLEASAKASVTAFLGLKKP